MKSDYMGLREKLWVYLILEHVGELIFRAKVVNFLIRNAGLAPTGCKERPSHNEDFRNDVIIGKVAPACVSAGTGRLAVQLLNPQHALNRRKPINV